MRPDPEEIDRRAEYAQHLLQRLYAKLPLPGADEYERLVREDPIAVAERCYLGIERRFLYGDATQAALDQAALQLFDAWSERLSPEERAAA